MGFGPSLEHAQVAQLVEHATENRSVGGSIPPLGTSKINPLTLISDFKKCACPHCVRINVVGQPSGACDRVSIRARSGGKQRCREHQNQPTPTLPNVLERTGL